MDAHRTCDVVFVIRRCFAAAALIGCALCGSGCQILEVADADLPAEPAPAAEPSDLARVLAAGHWESERNWSALDAASDSEVEPVETWRWTFVFPDPPKEPPANSEPAADVAELKPRYAWLWESEPQLESESNSRQEIVNELARLSRQSGAAGWTAAILLARRETDPSRWDALFEKLTPQADGFRVEVATQAAAAETLCRISSIPQGDPEVNLAPAGRLLDEGTLSEDVRGELFRGIARRIAPKQIPGLTDVMLHHGSGKLAPPLHRAAVEACVIHARFRRGEDPSHNFEAERWPDGLWHCRFAEDTTLRKLFGRWAALARHPDALAVLKAQRLDIELDVREQAVASLGFLDWLTARDELLAVMAKGTDPERTAAVACLAEGGSGELLRFVRDDSPRVRMAVARQLGKFPARASAVTLADLLRDRSSDVQLAALRACRQPDWKEHGRVSLLLHALRVGSLRAQMEALTQLRQEWGLEPIFPLNGSFEERDSAVRKLAQDHGVSAEVFTAFTGSAANGATEEALARQDDVRRLVRDYLHTPAATTGEPVAGDELKSLDPSAVAVIEQELERASGQRAEFLYREVLPKLHPGYAALVALESPDPTRRRQAAKELRLAAEQASLSVRLLERLSKRMPAEQDRQVWQDVLAAIVPDAMPEAAQIALVALNSPWPDIRQLGCDYFERHPQPEYAAWILPRLQDADRTVRLRAVRLLAHCGNPAALDGYREEEEAFGLRRLLTETDQTLRWETVVSMSRLGDPQAAQELVRQLYDPHPLKREQAALAMGQTGQSRFIEHLLRRSWTETDRVVQIALLKSLDQLAPMDDRPGLAPESSISDKITEWARWWETRQSHASPTAAREGSNRPLR